MAEFIDIRNISQCFKIGNEFRSPDAREHGKRFTWDNNLGFFVYEDDVKLTSAARENAANRLELTQSDNSKVFASLGALAWEDNVNISAPVQSVFGRTGPITAGNGDYSASQITNAFDKSVDNTDDLTEGVRKFVTSAEKASISANSAARHSHTNKSVLDQITDAGGGVIPTALQISTWNSYTGTTQEFVEDTVANLIKNGTGISWVYNDVSGTLTPTINLASFTTDNLTEGAVNKYATQQTESRATITLPAAGSVASRIAGAVAGVDYPTGWTLAASDGVNLLITHNYQGVGANVCVWESTGVSTYRITKPFSDGYTGVVADSVANTILIEGLDTLAVALRIEIFF